MRSPYSMHPAGSKLTILLHTKLSPFSTQGPVLFRHAAFVPPGYASLLFAHLYEPSSCPLPTTLFAGFRRFVLGSFGLLEGSTAAATGSSERPLVVRIISRRPGPGTARMARQIGNEEELLSVLRALGSSSGGGSGVGPLAVSLLDFAGLPLDQQLAAVAGTDILIGMHGAALTYAFLLSPHAALVELWPQVGLYCRETAPTRHGPPALHAPGHSCICGSCGASSAAPPAPAACCCLLLYALSACSLAPHSCNPSG